MAKQVKKVKKAKKASKSKTAKPATTAPKMAVTVPMQSVVQFVKTLIKEGRDGEFENGAKKLNRFVILDDDGVDFVKKFVARKKTFRRAMRATVLDPCPGNPFDC
jgi:hypothetical protein